MKPLREDIQGMVQALFTLTGSLERAHRQSPGASALTVLQLIATHDTIHPSDIAAALGVHQSTITRQVQVLETAGQVTIVADPDDRPGGLVGRPDQGRRHGCDSVGVTRSRRSVIFASDGSLRRHAPAATRRSHGVVSGRCLQGRGAGSLWRGHASFGATGLGGPLEKGQGVLQGQERLQG